MANMLNGYYLYDVDFDGVSNWVFGPDYYSMLGYTLSDGTVDSASDDGLLNWGDTVYLSSSDFAGPFTYITGAYDPLTNLSPTYFTLAVFLDAASGNYLLLTDNDDVGLLDLVHGNPDTGVGTGSVAFQYFLDVFVVGAWQGNALDNYASGTAGNDSLDGGGGNDTLYGSYGDDTLIGGAGADWMKGGTGNDTYVLGNDISDTYLFEDPGEGTDTILLSYNNYSLVGTNIENLTLTGGGGGNYTITGSASDNVITALIDAGSATFVFNGGDGNDTLRGAAGNDTLTGGAGVDSLVGGTGDDTYVLGYDTSDTFVENPGEGTDTIQIGYINYSLIGTSIENLTLTAGEAGSYTLTGNESNNILTALIDAGSATFVLNGGDGHDTLSSAAFNDTLNGGKGRDVLNGGAGDDSLLGGGSNDIITGGDGNDYLDGGNAGDKLYGNAGRDTLHGGASNDTLTGAGGRDVFLFDADLAANGIDTITDFLVGMDKVYVAVGVSGLGYTGVLNAANFVSGAAATTSDQLFIYDSGNLYYDADGSGAGAQVQFATFSNAAVLSASDIVIV